MTAHAIPRRQKSRGRQGPRVCLLRPPAQAGSAGAGSPGPGLNISPASPGSLCQRLTTLTAKKSVSFCSDGISCFHLCHGLLPCRWALLRKAWLPLLHSLPPGIYMYSQDPPPCFLFSRLNSLISLSQIRFLGGGMILPRPQFSRYHVTENQDGCPLPVSAVLASVSVGFCCSWDERRS